MFYFRKTKSKKAMIQIIKCKECETVFAACTAPECYTDRDWLNNLKKYIKRGDKVEMIGDKSFNLGSCGCRKTPNNQQVDLFSNTICTA